MIKLLFKNLWNRRGKHAWLFIELIVVTALAWEFMDAPVVSIADSRIPMGYDVDRLVHIAVGTLPESHTDFRAEETDSLRQIEALYSFLAKARSLDGVERATVNARNSYLNTNSKINTGFRSSNLQDSLYKRVTELDFWPGMEFFETYGIESCPGSDDVAVLSDIVPVGDSDSHRRSPLILTKDYAELFGTEYSRPGMDLLSIWQADTTRYTVAGVVGNVRHSSTRRTNCMVFSPRHVTPEDEFDCVLRLRAGIDADEFVRDLVATSVRELRTGNYYAQSVETYSDLIHNIEYEEGDIAIRQKGVILTVFFMLSLILGVTGSFYLQTRRRIPEIGIHRSFGAGKGKIIAMIMGEGVILASTAFIIGEIIYFNYALQFGLAYANTYFDEEGAIRNWISDFSTHFTVISAIVYVIIIACVCVGTWLPARYASRINPVDALRDE